MKVYKTKTAYRCLISPRSASSPVSVFVCTKRRFCLFVCLSYLVFAFRGPGKRTDGGHLSGACSSLLRILLRATPSRFPTSPYLRSRIRNAAFDSTFFFLCSRLSCSYLLSPFLSFYIVAVVESNLRADILS